MCRYKALPSYLMLMRENARHGRETSLLSHSMTRMTLADDDRSVLWPSPADCGMVMINGPPDSPLLSAWSSKVGRDDFRFFWNFITASQILPCVIETRRYGYIRDSGSRVETPHRATIGCEKFYNGCFHCCGHFWDKYTSALVHNFVCYQNSEIWLYTGLWK